MTNNEKSNLSQNSIKSIVFNHNKSFNYYLHFFYKKNNHFMISFKFETQICY